MQKLRHKNLSVQPNGLFISQSYGFLVATPDGLVSDPHLTLPHGLLEMKLIQLKQAKNLKQALLRKAISIDHGNNTMKMNNNHKYFFQIQQQMFVAQHKRTYFVLKGSTGDELYNFILILVFVKRCFRNFAISSTWIILPQCKAWVTKIQFNMIWCTPRKEFTCLCQNKHFYLIPHLEVWFFPCIHDACPLILSLLFWDSSVPSWSLSLTWNSNPFVSLLWTNNWSVFVSLFSVAFYLRSTVTSISIVARFSSSIIPHRTNTVVLKTWLSGSNMLMQHHPTLLNPTCCTRLATTHNVAWCWMIL